MNRFYYFLLFTFYFSLNSHAQVIENAGDYMTAITNIQVEMDRKYMAYISASAHLHRERKVERLRTHALESINNAKYKTMALPKYKGDNSLRQASIGYIQFCYRIFYEDYTKIVTALKQYLVLETITGMHQKFPQEKFVRIHRSYIVNIEKATAMKGNKILLNSLELPVGKMYKHVLADMF